MLKSVNKVYQWCRFHKLNCIMYVKYLPCRKWHVSSYGHNLGVRPRYWGHWNRRMSWYGCFWIIRTSTGWLRFVWFVRCDSRGDWSYNFMNYIIFCKNAWWSPEGQKIYKSPVQKKNSWNQINQCHEIFLNQILFFAISKMTKNQF